MSADTDPLLATLGLLFKPHPWHGVPIGEDAPETVTAFIEVVPTDTVKYEIDKETGFLTVDRPQKYSNVCPTLYGLIPRTYCADQVAALCAERTGREGIVGDGDPLDICVLAERPIAHGDLLLQAIPIGGLRIIAGNEADDKIVAVLKNYPFYDDMRDIYQCPHPLIQRLQHYFLTYKEAPDAPKRTTEITHVYDRREAYDVIRRAQQDYRAQFCNLEQKLLDTLRKKR